MRTSFNYTDNYSTILNSEKSDYVGILLSGYFDAPADGKYRFYMVCDDAGRLIIDNNTVINMNSGGWHDTYNEVYLSKGSHAIRIEYVEYNDRSSLAVKWAGPTFAEKNMDSFWNTSDSSTVLGEVIAWQKDSDLDGVRDLDEIRNNTSRTSSDSDGDGLTDYEELYIYHTNANAADSDGDGVNDYLEVKVAFSNANAADFNGAVSEIATLNGAAATASSSGWEKSGTVIYATTRNGWLEYDLTLAQAGTYALEVSGTQQNTLTTQKTFDITAYADGKASGRQTLTAAAGTVGKVIYFLPTLTAGNHKLKLVWNNIASNTFLQINSLRLVALGGPDADNNNQADWIDNRNANMSMVTIPATTKVSPVCIEGDNASYLDTISVSGFYTVPGEEAVAPTIIHGAKNKWYSNVPLNPNTTSELGVTFGYCNKTVTRTVNWMVTDVLTETAVTVRKGDSLKLAATPAGEIAGTVAITVDAQTSTTTPGGYVVHKFETAGTVTVNATFTPETGAPVSGTLTVTVLDASFAGIPFAVINCNRSWTNPAIPTSAVLEYDDSILVFRQTTNISLCGKTAGGAYIVARLGETGPVLASTRISVLDVNTHKNDGYYKLITTFDDGSKLVEGRVTLSEVPSDLRIQLVIYTAGTTFEDGTITKWLTAADFDANGVCRYRMLKSATSATATCHAINFYQGTTLVTGYRNW